MALDVAAMTDAELAASVVEITEEIERRKFVAAIPRRAAALLNDAHRAGVSIADIEKALRKEALSIIDRAKPTKKETP